MVNLNVPYFKKIRSEVFNQWLHPLPLDASHLRDAVSLVFLLKKTLQYKLFKIINSNNRLANLIRNITKISKMFAMV